MQAVQNYVSSAEWADARIKVAPGWVSANTKVDQSLYTDPIDQLSAKYLANPQATFRFDASDAMPAAVGSGAEWKAMVDWFGSGMSIAARRQGDRRLLAAVVGSCPRRADIRRGQLLLVHRGDLGRRSRPPLVAACRVRQAATVVV